MAQKRKLWVAHANAPVSSSFINCD